MLLFHSNFIYYLFLAVLGLPCSAWAFSSDETELLSSWSAWTSHCSGFSCCRAWAIGCRTSVIVVPGFWSTGSIVVAHRFSCQLACGIFLDQELNPCLLYWQADSLPLNPKGSPGGFLKKLKTVAVWSSNLTPGQISRENSDLKRHRHPSVHANSLNVHPQMNG